MYHPFPSSGHLLVPLVVESLITRPNARALYPLKSLGLSPGECSCNLEMFFCTSHGLPVPMEDYGCAQYNIVKLLKTLWEFWGDFCFAICTVGEVELADDYAGLRC